MWFYLTLKYLATASTSDLVQVSQKEPITPKCAWAGVQEHVSPSRYMHLKLAWPMLLAGRITIPELLHLCALLHPFLYNSLTLFPSHHVNVTWLKSDHSANSCQSNRLQAPSLLHLWTKTAFVSKFHSGTLKQTTSRKKGLHLFLSVFAFPPIISGEKEELHV